MSFIAIKTGLQDARLWMRYPAATMAPVVGMFAAWLVFGEAMAPIEFAGALLVMAGLGFNVSSDRLKARGLKPKG